MVITLWKINVELTIYRTSHQFLVSELYPEAQSAKFHLCKELVLEAYMSASASTMFVAGISVGDVSWPMSTQLPWRLAPVEGCCRASALLSGVVGQVSSGKTLRARLFGQG
ncbi:hypothetical protein ACFX2H_022254 [Malus domestica]